VASATAARQGAQPARCASSITRCGRSARPMANESRRSGEG